MKTPEIRRLEWKKDQLKHGASSKDSTWNGKIHICCKSKYSRRHKALCKNAPRYYKEDLSDLKPCNK